MSKYEAYYNTTPRIARAVRGFREGHLIIDEVADVFTKEIDNIMRSSTIEYVHTEQYRNRAMKTMFLALAALLEE